MKQALYKHLASKLDAQKRCIDAHIVEWIDKHSEAIESLINNYMPSGSGIDAGIQLHESSTPNKLVFTFSFHHMDGNGFYCGWTDYKLIVSPSLVSDFELRIIGRDVNDIKEYLYQSFEWALRQDVD